jgi:glutamate-1-semialdehyde 2,1-aminomutase
MKANKLYKKAKKVILNGNMLLSKRPEMYLPEYWPTYFSKAKGINVWDLNGRKYIDMVCAVGQSILGYANSKVDKEVNRFIKKGNMTTLNCPEEVELAEKLLSLHPWAGMVKFARSGGEANAIAVRISRAASKKDHVAICGYHGWHDWYLSVNLSSKKNLNDHLLPGLNPSGVPKALRGTVHPFKYNDYEALEKLVKKYEIGTIKMEVARSSLPNKKFLLKVRKLAKKNKIVLIFDECTTGFRRNNGGIHLLENVYPDMAMFGKALGNGYAITAIIGKKKIMKAAEDSFISSTFWTERTGYIAALKTLKEMDKTKSWKFIIKAGAYFNKKLANLSRKYGLKIDINGIEAISSFNFKSKNNLIYKTFISQEMLKKGYLASNIIFFTICHTKKIIDKYINDLDECFNKIAKFDSKRRQKKLLKGSVCHSKFKRLND